MAFIVANFTDYDSYITWCAGKKYDRYVLLTNVDTAEEEICEINPAGISKTGLNLQRHEVYEGIFTSITLKLDFHNKPECGGPLIKSAFDSLGPKANVTCQIYDYNHLTNDFDLWYTGKVNYSAESYEEKVSDDFISVNIIEAGKVAKMLSRDEIAVDINKLLSMEGNVITPFTNEIKEITFNPIDIALVAYFNGHFDFTDNGSASNSFLSGFYALEVISQQIDSRCLLVYHVENTNSYENTTGSTKRVNVNMLGTYLTTGFLDPTNAVNSAVLTIEFKVVINAVETVIFTRTVTRTNISITEDIDLTGTIDYNHDFTVLDTETLECYVDYSIVVTNMDYMVNHTQLMTAYNLVEYSTGAPVTDCRGFHVIEALTKLDLILTDETTDSNLIYSDVYGRTNSERRTYLSNGAGGYDFIIPGWQLRGFTTKAFNVTFRDLFKTLKHTRNVAMYFEPNFQRFHIRDYEQVYKDTQIINFGVVENLIIRPMPHPNKILAGYEHEGSYEDFSGANEVNLKSEYTLNFESKNELSLSIPLNADSVAIELLRRKGRYANFNEDTDNDASIFLVETNGTTATQASTHNASGFPSVEQYYNFAFTPRENLVRCSRMFSPFIQKTTEDLKFLRNTKDVDPVYNTSGYSGITNEQNNIDTQYLPEPYWYPEVHEFEAILTKAHLTQLLSDPHGYYRAESLKGTVIYGYIDNAECFNDDEKVKITGRRANINRS